jgi:hypothetical protein
MQIKSTSLSLDNSIPLLWFMFWIYAPKWHSCFHGPQKIDLLPRTRIVFIKIEFKMKRIRKKFSRVRAMENWSEFFSCRFSNYFIGNDLPIPTSYVLDLLKMFFRLKIKKNLEEVIFVEIHNFSETCMVFHFGLIFGFLKYLFGIRHRKLNTDMPLGRL